ncbi:NitT/TauT family transport system permease protein [Rhodococcus rhodochrous J3]|uniref:NitT/TauT family transport system permease protein n=1 Tax=Rhodococcus rhodochrous J3 TaxID=903528 RepID=A0ABY1MC58_RHORH|nr:ABC transporter permease [Rhodococcus rhodochrous]MBF4481375.1 ABC transporter permease [Rhodococcus rhodochrous]MDO1484773.1 ABC transporter permease [Rhodococcus rhodochrous]SMG31083.1 NitT/TauT family transport system permease protein [Rhodococcus rhodochrous J3]SNV15114.1 putative ABC transporter permease protein [Rhodococcus rhodochrous]
MTSTTEITPTRPVTPSTSSQDRFLRRTNLTHLFWGTIGVLGFLTLWELVARLHLLPRDALPPASTTLARAAELLTDPAFLTQIGYTLWAALVGYAIALVIAVPLGLLLGLSNRLYAATSTIVELVRPLPPIGLVPLLVLVAGQGLEMKSAVVALGCVFPLLVNTIHGVHSTNGVARATARSFGWSPALVAYRVVWPSAVPSVLTGVRVTVSIALILCIGAEFIGGSTTGLGSWLLLQSMLPQGIDSVCAGVIIAGLLGLLINAIVSVLETKYASWARRDEG